MRRGGDRAGEESAHTQDEAIWRLTAYRVVCIGENARKALRDDHSLEAGEQTRAEACPLFASLDAEKDQLGESLRDATVAPIVAAGVAVCGHPRDTRVGTIEGASSDDAVGKAAQRAVRGVHAGRSGLAAVQTQGEQMTTGKVRLAMTKFEHGAAEGQQRGSRGAAEGQQRGSRGATEGQQRALGRRGAIARACTISRRCKWSPSQAGGA